MQRIMRVCARDQAQSGGLAAHSRAPHCARLVKLALGEAFSMRATKGACLCADGGWYLFQPDNFESASMMLGRLGRETAEYDAFDARCASDFPFVRELGRHSF